MPNVRRFSITLESGTMILYKSNSRYMLLSTALLAFDRSSPTPSTVEHADSDIALTKNAEIIRIFFMV